MLNNIKVLCRGTNGGKHENPMKFRWLHTNLYLLRGNKVLKTIPQVTFPVIKQVDKHQPASKNTNDFSPNKISFVSSTFAFCFGKNC